MVAIPTAAAAAAAKSTAIPLSGITIAPALLTAQIGSKQPRTSTTIGVRNNFDVPVTVSAALNGFDIRNNALVPTVTTEKTLAGVVSLSPAEIVIPPGNSKNITVEVSDTASLAPGGHYLSILLTETAFGSRLDAPQLSLRPAVSVTLYVIKEDGAIRGIKARSLRLNRSLFSLPKTADATFFNDGNVQSVPRGVIRLSDSAGGAVLSQGILNQQSVPVYPRATVTLQAQLQEQAIIRLPGRYQASLQYRYDGQESTQKLTNSFWYVPKSFVIALLLIITVVGLAMWPDNRRRIRRYWRRVRRSRRPAFVAPDPSKIAEIEGPNSGVSASIKQPAAQRRKIDDIRKVR